MSIRSRKKSDAHLQIRGPDVPHEYERRSFMYDLKMCVRQRWLKSKCLRVDIELKSICPNILRADEPQDVMIRTEHWTERPAWELAQMGYKKCIGLHDSIVWWGVPVYALIRGGEVYDIRATAPDGSLLHSQDTSATLNDAMLSTSTPDFIRGMGRTALPAMDIQKIIFIVIIGIGALLGVKMLGII
jgi:hypothetical protein